MLYLSGIKTFYSVKINNYSADGWLNPQGDLERASDNTTCINHSGEQFMKEKLSTLRMTLEELNRSQWEDVVWVPIVHLGVSFLHYYYCVEIHFSNIN